MLTRAAAVLVTLVALSACGHGPPPKWNDASNELCQKKLCYRVGDLSPNWQEVHKEGASIGFYNRELGAVLQANASCRQDAEAAPLAALTRQLLIGYTDRDLRSQVRFPLAGREALRTQVSARLDGVPVILDLVVLRRNGCIYDLSYVAPPDRYPAGLPDFDAFVHGFVDERVRS
jgi:hypothetical protein